MHFPSAIPISILKLFMAVFTGGKPPEKNSGRYSFEKRVIVCVCGLVRAWSTIENGVAHCCAMQTTEIFTGDLTCKDNDCLVMMHTSDTRRSVWYKNK